MIANIPQISAQVTAIETVMMRPLVSLFAISTSTAFSVKSGIIVLMAALMTAMMLMTTTFPLYWAQYSNILFMVSPFVTLDEASSFL